MTIATADNGWINTAAASDPATRQRARDIVTQTRYGTLSTCSSDGIPWASPVFFVVDAGWTIYWASAIIARHSQNLYANQGRASIAIYSTEPDEGKGQGVFLSGTARELTATEVEPVIALMGQRSQPATPRSPADYLDASPRRLYGLFPQEGWITGERIALSDSILVDTKIQINLNASTPGYGGIHQPPV